MPDKISTLQRPVQNLFVLFTLSNLAFYLLPFKFVNFILLFFDYFVLYFSCNPWPRREEYINNLETGIMSQRFQNHQLFCHVLTESVRELLLKCLICCIIFCCSF